jgi:ParB family chromosome partitioning protein
MARKSLRDMSGIASTIARSTGSATADKPHKIAAPALGALQGALSSIREIDPNLIDDWGPADRFEEFTAVNDDDEGSDFETLKQSVKESGQQVPILVRRAKSDGRYEVIYGRRRLRACRDLGLKVRANVQDLDDATALLAKGLENASRRNLSFYEKARFAQAILAVGHDNTTVKSVLNLSAAGLSHLTKVTQAIPAKVGDLIGAAPKSGRPKWTALADLFNASKLSEKTAVDLLRTASSKLGSDDRLDHLIREASKRGARHDEVSEISPVDGVTIRSGRGSLSLSIKRGGPNAKFADWLDSHLVELIRNSYAEFRDTNPQGDD